MKNGFKLSFTMRELSQMVMTKQYQYTMFTRLEVTPVWYILLNMGNGILIQDLVSTKKVSGSDDLILKDIT